MTTRAPARRQYVTYFIQAVHGGPVKIGRSTPDGLQQRLRDLQCASPDVLHVAGTIRGNHERDLHRRWRDQQIVGEWFTPIEAMQFYAPNILLHDGRLGGDAIRAARDAYACGWRDALEYAARRLSEDVANAARRVLDDVAQDPIEPPEPLKMFALCSHEEAA